MRRPRAVYQNMSWDNAAQQYEDVLLAVKYTRVSVGGALQEFVAKCLSLPEESEIADLMNVANPDPIHPIRRFVIKETAANLRKDLLHAVEANQSSVAYDPSHKHRARRSLKNMENVQSLLDHPAFDIRNPNEVYSLIGGFCASAVNFHANDGSGYKFLADIVDKLNPQFASWMVSAFSRWRRFDEERQALSKAQLERITSMNDLSDNVFEIDSKSLAS